MAKLGTTPAANRYNGLAIGPDTSYEFETQEGQPVDGTNANNRKTSPFTIRIIPPEVLLQSVSGVVEDPQGATASSSIGLITAALQGADTFGASTSLADALAQTTVVDVDTTVLRQVVADGVFQTDRSSEFLSTIVDAATAADIALQLQYVLAAPTLTLLVNPTTMDISYTKIQSYSDRSRSNYIFEAWGEEQPKISFTFTTAGYYAGAVGPGSKNPSTLKTSERSGLMWASKRDSAAWQNFMSLYTFYRNNGYIFDTVGRSEAHLFIGAIAIEYDQLTYFGHFESLEYAYDEAMPHRVEFSMEFTVSQMFDAATQTTVVLPLQTSTLSPTSGGSANRSSQIGGGIQITTPDVGDDVGDVPLILFAG